MRIKQQAKILREVLAEKFSFDLGHCQSLDIVAQMYGSKNFHQITEKKKKRTKAPKLTTPALTPPTPPAKIETFKSYETLIKNGQWEHAKSIGRYVCDIYDKCNLLIHKESTQPLQPSFGNILWKNFFDALKEKFIILSDFTDDKQIDLLEINCGIYTLIEEHHTLYKYLFHTKEKPFANVLIWKDPEDNNHFYQSVEELESHLLSDVAICYTIAERSGASVGSTADILYFLKNGKV